MGFGRRLLDKTIKAYTNAPEDVWFSRDINNQQLQHWMIIVKYHKIELVREAENSYRLQHEYERGWTPQIEKDKPITKTRGHRGNGLDCWVLCGIGWCHSTDLVVDKYISAKCAEHPPTKRFTWTQCQQFLREIEDMVIHKRDDQNWNFFWNNTDVRRQTVDQLPAPHTFHQSFPQTMAQATGNPGPDINMFNKYQSSYWAAQQQNMAMNNQLMQNQQGPGYGYGN